MLAGAVVSGIWLTWYHRPLARLKEVVPGRSISARCPRGSAWRSLKVVIIFARSSTFFPSRLPSAAPCCLMSCGSSAIAIFGTSAVLRIRPRRRRVCFSTRRSRWLKTPRPGRSSSTATVAWTGLPPGWASTGLSFRSGP